MEQQAGVPEAEEPLEPGAASTPAAAAAPAAARQGRRRKSWLIGSSTLACAVGGALAGAFAFSAFSASMPGAPGGSLTTSSGRVPGNTGNLCTSTQNTPTAADTALSCQSFGVSSFAAHLARETRAGSGAQGSALAAERAASSASHRSRSARPGSSRSGARGSLPSTGTVPVLPGATTTKSAMTCDSTPAPPASVAGSVSVSASANGGKVAVKVGKDGLRVCGRVPSAPKLPSATVPSLPSLPAVPGAPVPKKHKHHHSGGVGGIVNGVIGGSGL